VLVEFRPAELVGLRVEQAVERFFHRFYHELAQVVFDHAFIDRNHLA
jgi:hypothetical protein